MKRFLLIGVLTLFSGCVQVYNEDEEDLRAVPVTNNPFITPQGAPKNAHASYTFKN